PGWMRDDQPEFHPQKKTRAVIAEVGESAPSSDSSELPTGISQKQISQGNRPLWVGPQSISASSTKSTFGQAQVRISSLKVFENSIFAAIGIAAIGGLIIIITGRIFFEFGTSAVLLKFPEYIFIPYLILCYL